MRDEQTGSWWQQVSGEAIQGPLKGRRLVPVIHDEVSFATWRAERPAGRVLKLDPRHADDYYPADWERQVKRMPTVTPEAPGDPLRPRSIVVGVSLNGRAKAYPFPVLRAHSPVVDTVGGVPIAVVVGDDGKSVRVFERTVDGRALELMAAPDTPSLCLFDTETGSQWDFTGTAVSGPLAGRTLKKVKSLKEYWFDW